MADAIRGKAVFDGLLDFPLPVVAGTADYLFYFVPDGDPYGKKSRQFFAKWYPNHRVREVKSLEELIGSLRADVTQHGVAKIREIVIVSHGTSMGLQLPLLASTTDANLKVLTAYSLAVLQHQVKAGSLADLKGKRDTVLTHLSAGSWVTVRACNFGQNDAAMYALYSFFGGNADVYAPRLYQWFGDLPVMHGMRLPSRAAVHKHLVKQRFLPKDIHTPDRQDAIVRALTDPANFSEPFDLATESLTGTQSQDYSDLVSSLTAGQVSAVLRSKLHDHGFDLTRPTVTVVRPDTKPVVPPDTWIVHDTLTDAASQEKFAVEYTVSESDSIADDSRTLTAQARLPDAGSAQETVILQLLLDDFTDQKYKGLAFELASTRDDDAPNADNKTAFDALKQLLDGNGASGQTFSAGSADLRARFEDADAKLADQATITLNTPGKTTPDGLPKSVWTIGPDTDGGSYLIKLEHPYQLIRGEKMRGVSSVRAHTLNVFKNLDGKHILAMQDALMSHAGIDLDSPGTELAASMDRLARDELIDLITFLRSPYKPRNVVALHHATQAIKRKGDFGTWMTSRFTTGDDFPFPSADPLTELSGGEKADKDFMIYDVEFDAYWAEVKASTVKPFAFSRDLFDEEQLWQRLDIPENELGTRSVAALEPDSPYFDIEELRRLESLGFNQYYAVTNKQESAPVIAAPTSCPDFKKVIDMVMASANLSPDDLRAKLGAEKTADGKSFLDVVLGLYNTYTEVAGNYSYLQHLATVAELAEGMHLPDIPSNKYEIGKLAVKVVAKKFGWHIVSHVIEFLEIDFVVTMPAEMVLHVWEEQSEGIEKTEAMGRLVGGRTWLRALGDLADRGLITPTESLVERIETIVKTPGPAGQLYYLRAYDEEMAEVEGTYGPPPNRFMLYATDFGKGFDEGVELMAKLWPDIERDAKQVMSDVLRETAGLDACKVQVLLDAGLVDEDKLQSIVVRAIVDVLLKELPHG